MHQKINFQLVNDSAGTRSCWTDMTNYSYLIPPLGGKQILWFSSDLHLC